jgi:succinate-semialdehyde dehydrogenase/glutarate-semialdehyde dehydrogenase
MSHSVPKLNDPSLLKTNVAYVNGEWVKAKSGKTFEVTGMYGRRFNEIMYD